MSENPQIYSYEYFRQLHAVEEQHWWSRGVRAIGDAMLQRHVRPRSGADVLDAGCGTGISLTWLSRYSAPKAVVGIDVAEEALAFSRERGHTQVQQGSVTDLPFEDASFDVVMCNDVIQHVPDDRQALRECLRVLRPGGVLQVRTNTKLGIDPNKPAEADDYRMYTPDELHAKLTDAGFEVEQITHVNALMAVVTLVKRYLTERGRQTYGDRGLPIRLLPPHLAPLNEALYRLMTLEARFLADPSRSLPFGSAIMFMARRPRS